MQIWAPLSGSDQGQVGLDSQAVDAPGSSGVGWMEGAGTGNRLVHRWRSLNSVEVIQFRDSHLLHIGGEFFSRSLILFGLFQPENL